MSMYKIFCNTLLVVWCVSAVAQAGNTEQAAKEKNVAKTVSEVSASEKMLPAPDVQLRRLAKGLGLTGEQQKMIRPLLIEEYATVKEIRQDENLTPKQIQAKVETLRNDTATKIQAVMTPEQREKYDVVRKEIKGNKQKRMRANRSERIGAQPEPPPRTIN